MRFAVQRARAEAPGFSSVAPPPDVFLVPCVIDSALIVYFCAGFLPSASAGDCAEASDAALPYSDHALRGTIARVGNLVTESADG